MPRRPPKPAPATHWISDPAQIDALASPIRQRILDRVEAIGPCSVAELAEALGRRPDALYYHVRLLTRLGLLAEVGSRCTVTSPESLFDLAHRRWHIAYAPEDPAIAAALRKLTRQMLRQAERDFDEGLDAADARGRGPERNLWSLRLEAHLTAAEQRELVAHLEAIVALLRKPKRTRRGRLTALTFLLSPIFDGSRDSE